MKKKGLLRVTDTKKIDFQSLRQKLENGDKIIKSEYDTL